MPQGYSSGDATLSTSGDAAITVLTVPVNTVLAMLIVQTGSANIDFEISWDGATWIGFKGGANGASVNLPKIQVTEASGHVQLRRIPGGTDVTGIRASGIL